jgi:hypothetical protein
MSRSTKALPARLYRDRRVALVDVFAVGDDGEPIAGDSGEFRTPLSGIWVDIALFAMVVVVAVGIEAGEERVEEMVRLEVGNTFTCIPIGQAA